MFTPGRIIGFVIFLVVLTALGILLQRLDSALQPTTDEADIAGDVVVRSRAEIPAASSKQVAAARKQRSGQAKAVANYKGRR